MTRIVVTGASGNVGTAVVRALSDHPGVSSIVGVCRREHDWRPPRTEWRFLDVAEPDMDLRPVFDGADTVVHLAWLFHPSRHQDRTWASNVGGASAVLRAVADARVPGVVMASSVGAYSPRASLDPVDERWPTQGVPAAAYSREKAYVERLLDTFEAVHPDRRGVRMRPSFIFQRDSAVQQRRIFLGPFVPERLLRGGRIPRLPLPRGLVLQGVHTEDVADAYVAAAVSDVVTGPFNLTGDGIIDASAIAQVMGTRVTEVPARAVRAALATAYALHTVPTHPGMLDLAMQVPMLSAHRAREVLGWRPRHSGLDAILAFLSGLAERPSLETPPLSRASSGPVRLHEVSTGLGHRDD